MANRVQGLKISGRLKESGITIYNRNGRTVTRTATSLQPERRTRKQFIARQQMLHSTRMWKLVKWAGTPMFPARPTAYNRFLSLMSRTEVVFLPQNGPLDGATMLLPDMPLSEGTMPIVKQHLGEVDGSEALVTNLTRSSLRKDDKLILYRVRRRDEGVGAGACARRAMLDADGRHALYLLQTVHHRESPAGSRRELRWFDG